VAFLGKVPVHPESEAKTMTRHLLRAVALLALTFLVLPALAFDDPKDAKPDAKKDDKDPKTDTKKEIDKKEAEKTEKRIKDGILRGKILNVDESNRSVRLQLTVPLTKLNEGAVNALAQAQANLQAAALRRDAQGIANANRTIAQESMKIYKIEEKKVEIQVTTIDDLKVRQAAPPVQFDDKGKVKKYTTKELNELKGPDTKLPGFPAEFSDLRQNQYVEVYLVKKKEAPRRPVAKKDKDAAADADLLAHLQPEVSMIVIIAEDTAK
jgi:hypothetical protein